MTRRLDVWVVTVGLGLAIAVLAILGSVAAWSPRPALARFDLDEERTVPAFFTAALLAVGAALALGLPRTLVPRGVAISFALLLGLASFDELAELHETLERRLDVDWQVLYLPVFAAAAAVLGLLVAGLRRRGIASALRLVLASGACWAVAQTLEALQWEDEGPAPGYRWMMVTEETLEMAGSALLLVALLRALPAGRLAS